MPDTTPTLPPFRYIDQDQFCLSARLLPDLNTGRPTDTMSITVEGSDEPQSAHVPVTDLPQVLAGIARAAGLPAPAAPVLEPQDHPGADLFVALQAAGLDADEANRRMYAYAAMVLRQEQATAAAPAAPADRATVLREAAEVSVRAARACGDSETGQYAASVAAAIGRDLRRLADEAQPTETEAHEHVWTTVPGNGAYAELIGHTWTYCRICKQRPTTAATEEPQP